MKEEVRTILTFEQGDVVELTFVQDQVNYLAYYLGKVRNENKWAFFGKNSLQCYIVTMPNIIEVEGQTFRKKLKTKLCVCFDSEQDWFNLLGTGIVTRLEAYSEKPELLKNLYHLIVE